MTKLISLNSLDSIDAKKEGLKCGLEIHQQLNTGKLFCSCPCSIEPNDTFDKKVERKLRFSLSETGEIDRAAEHEFKKGKYNIYKFNNKISCLVDLDEEPPRTINTNALSVAIRIGQMLNISFFDKFQFMRKLIIDGSVISGFQRTSILGIMGNLETVDGRVEIEGVNLEEDSCRTLQRDHGHTIYSLDRQGIPLIEITTGPQIKTPQGAQDVALQIGNILRSFSETKRGLGTIRQDVNVSIKGGARVEIKGTQNLKLMPEVVIGEMKRQKIHISIIEELKQRKIDKNNFSDKKIYDISKIFFKTKSKVILDNIQETSQTQRVSDGLEIVSKKNFLKDSKVLAIKLNKFEKILGTNMQENYRFATEISDRNKAHFPKIKGLFHSDELPNYGITESEVSLVRGDLRLEENDSFIMLAGDEKMITNSLNYILEIISELIVEIPSEVRNVDPKGILTKFSRPMPGSARMYPETDVQDIELDKKYFKEQREKIPELYKKKLERLEKDFNLEQSKIEEMLVDYNEKNIKNLIKNSQKNASFIYNVLFEIPKDIRKREKLKTVDFKLTLLENIFKEIKENTINQKTLRDLFISLYKDKLDEVDNLKKYLEKNNLLIKKIDEKEVENKIKEIIEKNKGAPFGALMGKAMGAFNGRVNGKIISEILKRFM